MKLQFKRFLWKSNCCLDKTNCWLFSPPRSWSGTAEEEEERTRDWGLRSVGSNLVSVSGDWGGRGGGEWSNGRRKEKGQATPHANAKKGLKKRQGGKGKQAYQVAWRKKSGKFFLGFVIKIVLSCGTICLFFVVWGHTVWSPVNKRGGGGGEWWRPKKRGRRPQRRQIMRQRIREQEVS